MTKIENIQKRLILFIGVVLALVVGFFLPAPASDLGRHILKVLLFVGVFGVQYYLLFQHKSNIFTTRKNTAETDAENSVDIPGEVLQGDSWEGFAACFKYSYEHVLFIARDAVVASCAAVYLKTSPDAYQLLAGVLENALVNEAIPVRQEGLIDAVAKNMEPVVESNLPIGTELEGFHNLEIRSFIGVPLMWSGEVVGVLGLGSDAAESFGEEDKEIVERCSHIITQIMAVCHRGQQWEGDQEVYAAHIAMEHDLHRAEDFDSAVSIFVQNTKKLFPFDRFTLCTLDGNVGVIQSVYGQIGCLDRGRRFNLADGLTGLVIRRKTPLIIGDLQEGDYIRPRFCKDEDHNHAMRTYLGVPLGRNGNIWGSISFESQTPYQYGDKGKNTLELLASTFATELERIQLYEQIRELKQGPHLFTDTQTINE